MRWPFGPPHMTLKKNKKKQKKTKQTKKQKKKKKEKKKKTRKHKKYSKMSFSVISENFLLFWVGVQNFPFLTTWAKKRAPQKNTIKIGVSGPFFLKSRCASPNGHFWTQKSQIHKFQLSFFACFLLFQQHKTQKFAETPIFIVF